MKKLFLSLIATALIMGLGVSCKDTDNSEDRTPDFEFDGAGEPGDVFRFDVDTDTATVFFENITTGETALADYEQVAAGLDIYELTFEGGDMTYGLYIQDVAAVMALPGAGDDDLLLVGAPRRTELSLAEAAGEYNFFSTDGLWGSYDLAQDGAVTVNLIGELGTPAFVSQTIDTISATVGESANLDLSDSADADWEAQAWFLPGSVMVIDFGPDNGYAVGTKRQPFVLADVAGGYQYLINDGTPGLFTVSSDGSMEYEDHGNPDDIAQITASGTGSVDADTDGDGFVDLLIDATDHYKVMALPGEVLIFVNLDDGIYGVGLML